MVLRFGPESDAGNHVLTQVCVDKPRLLRVGAAFGSEAGARALSRLMSVASSKNTTKQWLVGIQNGLTQPEALRYLAELPHSEVRVPHGRKTLESASLRAPTFFHPKIYVVQSDTVAAIVSSSANLTEGGLCNNVEQFLLWTGGVHESEAVSFDEWWMSGWKSADVADQAFIEAYEAVRPDIQTPGSARAPGRPIHEAEPAPSDLKRASWMWVEATRSLEGGSNNQLELMLTAHHFFYEEDDPPRNIGKPLTFIDAGGTVYENPDRIIHFNGPPMMKKGNSMWRIRLPTENEGLQGYQGGGVVIRFERTATPDRFRIDITELGGPEAGEWEAASRKTASLHGPPPRRMGWA